MNWKNKTLILFMVVLLWSYFVGLSAVSAEDQNTNIDEFKETRIVLNIRDMAMNEVGDDNLKDVYITKGLDMLVCPMLFVGNSNKWLRKVQVEMYDSNGTLAKSVIRYTRLGKLEIRCKNCIMLSTEDLAVGDYMIHFTYNGNKEDKLLPSSYDLALHVY